MCEEIFGPVITIFVYHEDKWEETLKIVDKTSEYTNWSYILLIDIIEKAARFRKFVTFI